MNLEQIPLPPRYPPPKFTTKIEFSDDFKFDWFIEGPLDDIKALTGLKTIISENFKSTKCQNIWQLRIDEISTFTTSWPNAVAENVKISLKLLEYADPSQIKLRYKCEANLTYYEGHDAEKPQTFAITSTTDLYGSEVTDIKLYELEGKNFSHLRNVHIICRIQSEPQLVNVNSAGGKKVEIQKTLTKGNKNWANKEGKILTKILKHYPQEIEVICKSEIFQIHKYLLTVQSEVFAKMFEVDLSEKQKNRIVIEDFEPEIVQVFLGYLKNLSIPDKVGKEIEKLGWVDTMELFKMSHMYQIDDLKTECEALLCHKICLGNAIELLEFGKIYGTSQLESSALKFILCKKSLLHKLMAFDRLAEENPKLLAHIQSQAWKNVLNS